MLLAEKYEGGKGWGRERGEGEARGGGSVGERKMILWRGMVNTEEKDLLSLDQEAKLRAAD